MVSPLLRRRNHTPSHVLDAIYANVGDPEIGMKQGVRSNQQLEGGIVPPYVQRGVAFSYSKVLRSSHCFLEGDTPLRHLGEHEIRCAVQYPLNRFDPAALQDTQAGVDHRKRPRHSGAVSELNL